MTATETRHPICTLACDEPECGGVFEAETKIDQRSASRTRYRAREAGWDVPPIAGPGSRSREDYYPDHHRRDPHEKGS